MSIPFERKELERQDANQIDHEPIIEIICSDFEKISDWMLFALYLEVYQKLEAHMNKKDRLKNYRDVEVKIVIACKVRVPESCEVPIKVG